MVKRLAIKTEDEFNCSADRPEFVLLHASNHSELRAQRRKVFQDFANRHQIDGVFISGVQHVEETRDFVRDVMANDNKIHYLENAFSTFSETQEACFRIETALPSVRANVHSITEREQWADVKRGVYVASKDIGISRAPRWEIYGNLHTPVDLNLKETPIQALIKDMVARVSQPGIVHPLHKWNFDRNLHNQD